MQREGNEPVHAAFAPVDGRPWLRSAVLFEPRVRSVPDALREVAAAVADRTAVDDGRERLTFAELLRRTDAVARAVDTRARAGYPQVSVVVDRGLDGLVDVLGVMGAGRVAVPLDAHDPAERLSFVHREADASLLVTRRSSLAVAERVARGSAVVVLDDEPATVEPWERAVDPARLALVLFTSGSSGAPKGVVRDHDTIVRHALVVAYANEIGSDDRVAVTGSFGFVGAYARALGACFGGGTACPGHMRRDGLREFAQWVVEQQITVLQLVPSVLRALVDVAPVNPMTSVKLVILGGETLYAQDVRRARPLFGPRTVFQNRLGATEGASPTGWNVTEEEEQQEGPLPVGRIEPWVDVRVLDASGEPVGAGEPGRLEVTSDHQALGYWRDPDLTAACFTTLADGRRAFWSSDIVRVRDDGVLEYLGRADDRVKVRGAMVSPSEVELALHRLVDVDRAAVVPIPAPDGGTRLAAYVVPAPDASVSAWQIRRDLAAHLPTTMVPSVVVPMTSLPVSARGKVDRSALPPPPTPTRRAFREPVGRERELAELFAEVLGLDTVGLDDDFFELGGDSLAVIELLAGIEERFGVELTANAVLASPTVADLATRLVRRRSSAGTIVLLRGTTHGNATPLFCVAGGGSPAVSLRPLADSLGDDRRFYGAQARGLEETARPDRSVEAAARRHLVEVRATQPRGPYLLAGYSVGGLVAFEMACRLEADGETVALLALLDTPAPSVMQTRTERLAVSAPSAHEGTGRRLRWATRGALLHLRERAVLATAGIVPRRSLYQYHLFYRFSRRMARAYRPGQRFGGAVVVFHVDDARFAPDLGWSAHVGGTVTTVEVPGSHESMVRRPYVAAVGAELARAAARTETGRSEGS
ncbi:MAG TPA: AMP-binding protein [Acidimicrobiia bacterium]|nr:AMP-binding protein [Acidimicrobiia bacterium]